MHLEFETRKEYALVLTMNHYELDSLVNELKYVLDLNASQEKGVWLGKLISLYEGLQEVVDE